MIRFSGQCFAAVDNRLMSLQLLETGLTDAAMFAAKGEVLQPADFTAVRYRLKFAPRSRFRGISLIRTQASLAARARGQ